MTIKKEKYIFALINAIEHKGLMEVKAIERNIEYHLSKAESMAKEQEAFNGNDRKFSKR